MFTNHESISSGMCSVITKFAQASENHFETGGVNRALFYETDSAIVFPPSSDKADGEPLSIAAMLAQAQSSLQSSRKDVWLFPVAEQQGMFWGVGPARMHWVTLHFVPSTGTLTIVDSRFLSVYSTATMQALLTEGLASFGMQIRQVNDVLYQGVQTDHHSCGLWTLLNLQAYAYGASLEGHRLSTEDLGDFQNYVDTLCSTSPTSYAYRPRCVAEQNKKNLVQIQRRLWQNPLSNLDIDPCEEPADNHLGSVDISSNAVLGPATLGRGSVILLNVEGRASESDEGSVASLLESMVVDTLSNATRYPDCHGQNMSTFNHSTSSISDTDSSFVHYDFLINAENNADFEWQCIQCLLVLGCALLVVAILMCPPVAAAIGVAAGIANMVLIMSSVLAAVSFLLSGIGCAYVDLPDSDSDLDSESLGHNF